jgi:hypothetical protein
MEICSIYFEVVFAKGYRTGYLLPWFLGANRRLEEAIKGEQGKRQ